jgi:hypothetical protein
MTTLAFLLLLAAFFVAFGRSTAGADRPPLRTLSARGWLLAVARGAAELSRLHASRLPEELGGPSRVESLSVRSGHVPGHPGLQRLAGRC